MASASAASAFNNPPSGFADISGSEVDTVYKKITRRLVPLIFLAYLLAFLDRINVGYAQLQMKDALGFSDAVYGFGAGSSSSAIFCSRFQAISSWSGSAFG